LKLLSFGFMEVFYEIPRSKRFDGTAGKVCHGT
jgi:hypothetical protein